MHFSMQHWLRHVVLMNVFFTAAVFAAPSLHLLFHMGAGANSQFFVGGTLENKGDEDVYSGFVVVSPLSEDCYPQAPLLSSFGVIKAGEKYEFRIPIQDRLLGYKLDTVHGVDSFGNPVQVVDELAEVMESKRQAYLARCQLMRKGNPPIFRGIQK
ncbi:hypothetical protein ACUVMQ_21340 [Aeromonas veronii]|uniref:hypothetical protein n=1 Tax=Aeromonas veronii TaxID=654 RepID=UPI004055383B